MRGQNTTRTIEVIPQTIDPVTRMSMESFTKRKVAENHPNWFDASFVSWLSYDALHVELPDGYLYFLPIVNWGKYREENGRWMMPLTVRLNHAIADGYLVAKVFRLLEEAIAEFCK